jgi:4-hydroxybenzoate polyprenyltransferase
MLSFLKLIRWPNILTIILTEIIVKYGIMDFFLHKVNLSYRLDSFTFTILILSSVFIAAAGNIINDIKDEESDRIKHIVQKPIVNENISIKQANIFLYVFGFLGVVFSIISGILIGETGSASYQILVLTILVSYSYGLKCKKLVGNFIVSLVTASVPILIWFYMIADEANNGIMFNYELREMHFTIFFFAFFAFITNFIREIIKDREDKNSDLSVNCKTWAALVSITTFKRTLIIMLIGFSIFVFLFQILSTQNVLFRSSFLIIHFMVFAFIIPSLLKANSILDFHKLSTIMKVVMLIGVLTPILLWI